MTYGKFYLLAVLAVLACAFAACSRRPGELGWAERWGWRLTVVGYGADVRRTRHGATGSRAVDGGFAVILLSMLIGIFGNVLLGIGLLRGGFRPRPAAGLILLDLPLSLVLVEMSTMALEHVADDGRLGTDRVVTVAHPVPRTSSTPTPVAAALS